MSEATPKALMSAKTTYDKTMFGFWIYLMTDCVLFASLFAVYAVLHNNTYGGPSGHALFSLPYILVETFSLLTSSFFCGLAMISLQRREMRQMIMWLLLTAGLGILFLGMELHEFTHLVQDGNSWRRSGFLSSYFTLVGTHGLHIAVGLMWVLVLMIKTLKQGFTEGVVRRLTLFSLFWHFLDIVWIFIFTIVYLMGVA